jgi:hypothetical protein
LGRPRRGAGTSPISRPGILDQAEDPSPLSHHYSNGRATCCRNLRERVRLGLLAARPPYEALQFNTEPEFELYIPQLRGLRIRFLCDRLWGW